jgi:hypothetical protein
MDGMDETRRHVVEDIPASELPERLRGDFAPGVHVTVTVEEARRPVRVRISELIGKGRGLFDSPEDVLHHLREGRDAE